MPSHETSSANLKVGSVVRCPPLPGSPGFIGRVTRVDRVVQRDLGGREFRWVTVQPVGSGPSRPTTVPSYQLS